MFVITVLVMELNMLQCYKEILGSLSSSKPVNILSFLVAPMYCVSISYSQLYRIHSSRCSWRFVQVSHLVTYLRSMYSFSLTAVHDDRICGPMLIHVIINSGVFADLLLCTINYITPLIPAVGA